MRRTLTMLLLATALGAAASAPADARDQVFRINNMVEPESLDPGIVTGVPEHRILSNLFEGLTTTDPKDLSPRPGMAASWSVSKDGLRERQRLLTDAGSPDGRGFPGTELLDNTNELPRVIAQAVQQPSFPR